MTERNTARLVGGLFVLATVAGVTTAVLTMAVTEGDSPLQEAAAAEGRVLAGALVEFVMAGAIIAIPIAAWPVLRRVSAELSVGYVVTRAIEGALYLVDTAILLTFLRLGQEVSPSSDGAIIATETVESVQSWTGQVAVVMVFAASAMMFNWMLYRASLVPRWLSLWGLIGAVAYFAAGPAVLFGLEPFTAPQVAMFAALALQEMALAAWLIIKGFDTTDRAPLEMTLPETEPLARA